MIERAHEFVELQTRKNELVELVKLIIKMAIYFFSIIKVVVHT